MGKFIAAMDHSGGSTGGVLERYGQEYTEEDKMDKVHEMRLRMVNSPEFNSDNIWAAILYKDTVERGMVPILKQKGIQAYLKIDSGTDENGILNDFDLNEMLNFAVKHGCTGTKMRSIVKSPELLSTVLHQQFKLAEKIHAWELMPIVEPEIPIDHPNKQGLEIGLDRMLHGSLDALQGKCILKLTLPEQPMLYEGLTQHYNAHKVVGLSGGYSTKEACRRLAQNTGMSASFSRALSENLLASQSDEEFNKTLSSNIRDITEAS
jgi:fructose-bisphosphate aldolase class I